MASLSLGSSAAPAAAAAQAQQQDAAGVDAAVSSLVDVVRAAGEAVKQGVSAAQTGADYARSAYDQVRPHACI